ncbi:MAG TPA: hypothetical protein VEK15_02540 [Vicinamibacteria bacterium]|nr:hypothetical protein [Vicinamibacteria bacterium]
MAFSGRGVRLAGASRKGTDSIANEDAFRLFHEASCGVVFDGAGRANQAAKRGASQFERLLRNRPPVSLPDWAHLAKLIDSFLVGIGRSTLAGFRFVRGESGWIVSGVVIGDAKLLHVSREGEVRFVSQSGKDFLGTGAIDPVGVYLRPQQHDIVVAASDGAWAALGGAHKMVREILSVALRGPIAEVPVRLLEKPRFLLDDATLVIGILDE